LGYGEDIQWQHIQVAGVVIETVPLLDMVVILGDTVAVEDNTLRDFGSPCPSKTGSSGVFLPEKCE
jgi:hypothetical protein